MKVFGSVVFAVALTSAVAADELADLCETSGSELLALMDREEQLKDSIAARSTRQKLTWAERAILESEEEALVAVHYKIISIEGKLHVCMVTSGH